MALIRAEQRLIQQASAQCNASGAPEATTVPADTETQPEAPVTAPLTTHGDETPATSAAEEAPLTAPAVALGPAPRHDWVDYFTLLLSLTSAALLFYLVTNVLPAMSRRINNLSADPEPEPEPQTLANRLRPTRSPGGLREDRYDEDEEDDEPADNRARDYADD